MKRTDLYIDRNTQLTLTIIRRTRRTPPKNTLSELDILFLNILANVGTTVIGYNYSIISRFPDRVTLRLLTFFFVSCTNSRFINIENIFNYIQLGVGWRGRFLNNFPSR